MSNILLPPSNRRRCVIKRLSDNISVPESLKHDFNSNGQDDNRKEILSNDSEDEIITVDLEKFIKDYPLGSPSVESYATVDYTEGNSVFRVSDCEYPKSTPSKVHKVSGVDEVRPLHHTESPKSNKGFSRNLTNKRTKRQNKTKTFSKNLIKNPSVSSKPALGNFLKVNVSNDPTVNYNAFAGATATNNVLDSRQNALDQNRKIIQPKTMKKESYQFKSYTSILNDSIFNGFDDLDESDLQEEDMLTPDGNNEHVTNTSEQNSTIVSSTNLKICENNVNKFEGLSEQEKDILNVKMDSSEDNSLQNKISSVENFCSPEKMNKKTATHRLLKGFGKEDIYEDEESTNKELGFKSDLRKVFTLDARDESESASNLIPTILIRRLPYTYDEAPKSKDYCRGAPLEPLHNQRRPRAVSKSNMIPSILIKRLPYTYDEAPKSKGHKKKTVPSTGRKTYDEELVCVPFSTGWKREHVIRATATDDNKRPSDIYYYSPDGSKLRSMPDIGTYLSKHPDIQLTLKNFTFVKTLIHREPFEVERKARTTVEKDVATKKQAPLKSPVNVEK